MSMNKYEKNIFEMFNYYNREFTNSINSTDVSSQSKLSIDIVPENKKEIKEDEQFQIDEQNFIQQELQLFTNELNYYHNLNNYFLLNYLQTQEILKNNLYSLYYSIQNNFCYY